MTMSLTAEWRKYGEFDVVLVLDGSGTVRQALAANSDVLFEFLEPYPKVGSWRGDRTIDSPMLAPEAWGELIMARQESGEIITMNPEEFWAGIHIWFRSRGVDYNTPRPS
jgi:hypothetical protein